MAKKSGKNMGHFGEQKGARFVGRADHNPATRDKLKTEIGKNCNGTRGRIRWGTSSDGMSQHPNDGPNDED
jgi:hypothetical protein